MNTPFDLIQALRSWFFAKDGDIHTGGNNINTGGGDVIVGAGSVDGVDLTAHVANADAHHNESHTVVSHSDTTGTGAELDTLTDGSDAGALHIHDARYFQESEFSDNPGAASKPLESDSDGFLEVEGFGINVAPTTNDLRINQDVYAGGDIYANSGLVHAGTTVTAGSSIEATTDVIATNSLRCGSGIAIGSIGTTPGDSLIMLQEKSSPPSTPPSGWGYVWCNTSGQLYFKNDAGDAYKVAGP